MSVKIGAIIWGVRDLDRAIKFWCAALHYKLRYEPDVDFAILEPQQGQGVQLSLNVVSSAKPKRHHMDLFTEDQQGEVERLIALGATRANWVYPEDADYVVLVDPDGNPFCVVQI